ncbi:uncharacterized protein LOC133524340 [Cydia pomonella]|uniref:uncharacterized protein LOC133524340 n=1 Tax=Cydia pomonella TaxID=82600 RepID=UPI002ADE1E9B|nr:uncharacterized protein LOC133524340 [Cydia pomonella]
MTSETCVETSSMSYEQHSRKRQVLMDTEPDDERQLQTLSTGQRITLAEYKRIHQPMHMPGAQPQLQQPRSDNGRQTLVRSKEQQRPVQRVPFVQSQQVAQHDNNEPPSGPSEQSSEPQSAKMLIFLQNGEQRLITFTLPKVSCTLKEVLEKANVPFSEDTHIQCMQNTSSEIDYFVSIGTSSRIEDLLENHPHGHLLGNSRRRSRWCCDLRHRRSGRGAGGLYDGHQLDGHHRRQHRRRRAGLLWQSGSWEYPL